MVPELTRVLHRYLADLQSQLDAHADPTTGFADLVAAHLPDATIVLDTAYAELTVHDEPLAPAEQQAARARHRMLVQPFFLQAAMLRWAIDKPLGYPGDFQVVNHIFDPPRPGNTPLGDLLAHWSYASGPARAHRARREWAVDRLRRNHARHVLSFACGPERVLRDIHADGRPYDITLCDHDLRAVEHAEKHLRERAPDNLTVRAVRQSVQRLIVSRTAAADLLSPATRANHGFDAILVLGLLDYLGEAAAARLIAALVPLLRPGGELLLTNLDAGNLWRSYMDYTLEWTTRHRTRDEFAALAAHPELEPLALAPDPAAGVNLFYVARRTP